MARKARKSGPAQPGSVRPNMHKMFDGQNVATRPIPVTVYESDRRAIDAAAADQKPKAKAVQMPNGPRPSGTDAVFGSKVPGSTNVNGGTFNPAVGDLHLT